MRATDFDIELELLLEAIYRKYHHDFRHYARASLRRRVARALDRFGCASVSMLQHRIMREPAVFDELLGVLTVQVSEMFRDASFFRSLRSKVLPALQTDPSLRIWMAGCSSGEEVYSLAILLHEEGLLTRSLIYATDIHPDSLRKAEAGIYPLDRMAQFSTAYRATGGCASLADYYTAAYGAAVFSSALRKGVLFSDHSLATDGVFAEVQLVVCRNVLIYFDHDLQDRALGLFRDSLSPGGFLGLGAKETLRFSSHAGAFHEFVYEDRIYQRR